MSKFRKTDEVEASSEYQEIDLLRLLRAFWHRAWLIVIVAIIGAGAGFSYAKFFITPTYQSSVLLYVDNESSLGGINVSLSDLNVSKSLVPTYIVLLKTRMTLDPVIERAKENPEYGHLVGNLKYESLVGRVSAAAVNETQVFKVTVTDSDKYRAALLAQTIGEVLGERVAEIISGSKLNIVDNAEKPNAASSPNITKYTSMGMIIGIVLAAAVIVVLELLDDRVRDEQYLIQNYNLPVLASIPDFTMGTKGTYYYKRRNRYGYRRYGAYYERNANINLYSTPADQDGSGAQNNEEVK